MRATKESGFDWLGTVPENWVISRIGACVIERRETVSDTDFQPLSVTKSGVVPRLESAAKSDNAEGRKLIREGDFVINSRSDRKGSSGVSALDGSCSVVYIVLELLSFAPEYAHHLFRSQPFQEEFYRWGSGIVDDLWSTRYSAMKQIAVPVPPLEEQRAIADFLDRETSKIDALIAKQEELIITLGERKRAELSKAVREGIYGSAMADSRYVWLGKTPKDWDTLPIWSILRIKRELVGGDWRATPLLSLTKRGIIPRDIESGKGKFPESFETYQLVEPDDLVFCHFDIEETPRTVGLVEIDGMLTGAYTRYVVINKERYDPKFLSLLFEDIDNEKRLKPFYTGLRNTMQKDRFASLRIALPSIGEQKRIVDFLERKISSVDKLASQAVSVNELLKERRQSLISAAVAGKIDLRKGA